MRHIITWSGGKDSTATVILMHEHLQELINPEDEVCIVHSEIMFDKTNDIPGVNPDIHDFIQRSKKIFEQWGFHVEIVKSDTDFLDFFNHRLQRSPNSERIGLKHGFPVPGKICGIKRECKLNPIKAWIQDNSDNAIQYEGIAIDEPERLVSVHKQGHISLLERYHYTEKDAMKLCRQYDMVSPQYFLDGQKRDGCWFCGYAKLCEHAHIKETMPEVWAKYVALENIPGLAYRHWNPYSKQTLHERDKEIEINSKYQ